MKATRILIFILVLLIPIAGRTLWFYQGVYQRSEAVATPDYANKVMPMPNISTPIAETVKAKEAAAPIVLLDYDHGNSFMLSEIEPLTRDIENGGGSVRVTGTNLVLEDGLKYSQALVVICPTQSFSSAENEAIKHFIDRGGRLFVVTDPTRDSPSASSDSKNVYFNGVDVANQILEKYGITFSEDYAYNLVFNEANFRNVILKDITKSPITAGMKEVVLYGAHTLKTSANGLIYGDTNTLSSKTDEGGKNVMAASSKDGNVLALGDMTFLTVPYNTVLDNQVLISNIAGFLLNTQGTSRIHDLQDYPYLYNRPVSIIKSSDLALGKDLLDAVSSLEKNLKTNDVSASLAEEAKAGNDLLVLGTYSTKETQFLAKYIEPFNLKFTNEVDENVGGGNAMFAPTLETTPAPTATIVPTPTLAMTPAVKETPNTVNVPGFGKMKTNEVGIILFTTKADQNITIMLANTSSALKELVSTAAVDLSSCTVQGKIAICTLTSTASSSETGGGINYNAPGPSSPSFRFPTPAG